MLKIKHIKKIKSVKKGENRMAKFCIPDTELGFIGFPETISGFFKNMPLIPYNRETCGAIDIKFGKYNIFLPKNITKENQDIIYDKLDRLCCKSTGRLFFKRNKEKLVKFMETMYEYSEYDPGYEVAIKIYKNMDKKKRESKPGMVLKAHLMVRKEYITAFYIRANEPELLKDFLDFKMIKPETLKELFKNECDSSSAIIRSYMMKAIKDAKDGCKKYNNEKCQEQKFAI